MHHTAICLSYINYHGHFICLCEGREMTNMCFFPVEQVLESFVCQVCVSTSIYPCVSSGVQNALASGTSVSERMCECGCGIVWSCVSVLFTSWLGGDGQGGVAVYRLLSSLYSNDRPCCFTCCGGQPAVQLSPSSKTRTQALPVGITWVSPYVFRPSTQRLKQQEVYIITRIIQQVNQSCFPVCLQHIVVQSTIAHC